MPDMLRLRLRVIHGLAVREGAVTSDQSLRFAIGRGYIAPNPDATDHHDRYMITEAGRQLTDVIVRGR